MTNTVLKAMEIGNVISNTLLRDSINSHIMRAIVTVLCCLLLSVDGPVDGNVIEGRERCTDKECQNTSALSHSEEYILRVYRGILLTLDEIEELHRLRKETRFNLLQAQTDKRPDIEMPTVGDGDACCPTEILFYLNYTMTSVSGQPKSIIHMPNATPPRYQYIPHGKCVGHGTCGGTCVEEATLLTLLIVDGGSLAFDFLLVPGYCSCKNF